MLPFYSMFRQSSKEKQQAGGNYLYDNNKGNMSSFYRSRIHLYMQVA